MNYIGELKMSKMGKIIKIPKAKLITLSNKMYDDIDIFKPDEIIICSELLSPSDIYEKMRSMNTGTFAYMFDYVPFNKKADEHGSYLDRAFLKVGETSGNDMGERLVRQIRHLDGWDKNEIQYSSNGIEFRGGCERLIDKLGYPEDLLNKNNINIGIWSINETFRWCNLDIQTKKDNDQKYSEKEIQKDKDKQKAKWIEGELCYQHINIHGKLPPLNEKDPSKCKIYTDPRMPNPNIRPVQFKVG